jgi:uncharacterized protein YjdB
VPTGVNQIAEVTHEGDFTVKGVVVAVSPNSILLDDNTGRIVYYGTGVGANFALGDYVKVSQTITVAKNYRYGNYQFTLADGAVATQLNKANAPVIDATPTPYGATEFDAWFTAMNAGSGPTIDVGVKGLTPTQRPLVTMTIKAIVSGTYYNYSVDGSANQGGVTAGSDITALFAANAGRYFSATGYLYEVVAQRYAYFWINSAELLTIAPTGITVTAAGGATSVRVAETLALTATVAPDNATDKAVLWSSSDETKATVDANGIVTGVAEGEVTITATSHADSSIHGSIVLTIAPKAATPVESLAVDAEALNLLVTDTHQVVATILPADANQSVSYASDAEAVATVSSTGLITAVGAGTANISVTTVGVDAEGHPLAKTIVVSVALLPEVTPATIAELNLKTANDTTHLYEVSGILEGLSHTDQYGNGYLTNPATKETIKIYGSTATASAITYASGALKFVNPKDATTTLADYNNGELVTMHVLYVYYAATSTPEITGFFVSHVADSTAYDIVIDSTEHGTVTADVATAVYGATVTLTVTPDSGYAAGSVKVKNAQGVLKAATVNPSDATKYTFAATCVNEVVVVFQAAGPVTVAAPYTVDFESTHGFVAGTTYNNATEATLGATYTWNVLHGTATTTDNGIVGGTGGTQIMELRHYNADADIPVAYMNFEVTGTATVSFDYFLNNINDTGTVFASTDSGASWNSIGTLNAAAASTKYSFSYTFAPAASVRLKIQLNSTAAATTKLGFDTVAFATAV